MDTKLSDRKQRVYVNHKPSDWANVISGIPQGSVLGPILFVLFINDLPDVVSSTVKIFADDTKIFDQVNTPEGCEQIQRDIDRLSQWSKEWQLRFNEKKCKVMHLGHKNTNNTYTMNNSLLESTEDEKDLGVITDNHLNYKKHVISAVNKASRMLGLIRSTFTCLDVNTVPTLYKAMVRPHLEYGNIIWSP